MGNWAAFASYCHSDNETDEDAIIAFCEKLTKEVHALTADRSFKIFVDKKAIAWGEPWRDRINNGLADSTYLIPFITPSFFESSECKREFLDFLQIESERGRKDLILPVYYITDPRIEQDPGDNYDSKIQTIARVVRSRQYVPWNDLRYEDDSSSTSRKRRGKAAQQLVDAMRSQKTLPSVAASIDKLPKREKVVFPGREGFFQTIQAALDAAEAGDSVVLSPSKYEVRELDIAQQVEIIGKDGGENVEIIASGKYGIRLSAPTGALRNLQILHQGGNEGGVVLSGKLASIVNCGICSRSGPAVSLVGESEGRVSDCILHHSQYGVACNSASKVTIRKCTIRHNAVACYFLGPARCSVLECVIENNRESIWLYCGPEISVSNNSFTSNRGKDYQCENAKLVQI